MTDSAAPERPSESGAEPVPLPRLFSFFLRFMLLQLLLFTGEMLQPVQERLIQPFTAGLAWLCWKIMSLFDASIGAEGLVIYNRHSDFAIEVVAGCNGVEATIILLAGILAFRAPWGYKLWGIAWGFVAIHALNLLRIISLFYIGQWHIQAYEWAHLYIWQALILLDAIIVWLIWIRRLPRAEATPCP